MRAAVPMTARRDRRLAFGAVAGGARRLVVGALVVLAATTAAGHAPALAQTAPLASAPQSANQPLLLQADEMIYDNQNNTVVARGNVEIYWNNYTLLADQVVYDQSANTLAAEGNVRIKEPDGALIHADRITLTDDFRDGFLRSLEIVTQDDSRIAAARAIRDEGERTVFERAVFTPCRPCETDPTKPPTWSIKAHRVIHRKSEATIEYRNAWFEFLGAPIAWVPWFKHADPSVKRKSGFLIPVLRSSKQLGFAVETPYYFALAPNYDFTFSPMFTEKQGVLLQGTWRHRTHNGRYRVDLAGIYETDPKEIRETTNRFRGSIKTQGDFAINRFWSWGWDVTADTDDTFRRYYGLDNILRTDRVSQVYLTGLGDRNYFDARMYRFGGLLFHDTDNSNYQVHPVIDYNVVAGRPVFGGELSFNTNIVSLTRDNGADSHRLITEMHWRRSLIDPLGQVYTPFVGARGDVYRVANVVDPITGLGYGDDTITRGMALVGAEYRYPFVAHGARASHVVEPIAQIVARPNISNQHRIPNEDARSLVFDDTLLFDVDKFSGYDRIESGTRANIGVRYTLQRYIGGHLQAVFGQSIHLGGDNDFPVDSGLESRRSDYVAGIYFEPSPYLSLIAQMRFDERDFEHRRTDLTAAATYGPFSGSISYASIDAQPGLGILDPREEIQAKGNIMLTKSWSLFGNIRYDLYGDQRVRDAIGIRYADDCFALAISYEESFIRDRDIEPDQKLMFRFELKHLGVFNVEADPRLVAGSDD